MGRALTGYSRRLKARNAPRNCRSVTYSRGLKELLCALALVLGTTVARGEWVETRITIPDSLGGTTGPIALTTDSSERYVYISDIGGNVYVVDGEAGTRVAKILTDTSGALCTNSLRNKVYAAHHGKNSVAVISCATNQVIATIPVGSGPNALCYNSRDDKVYCANYTSDDLTIMGGASDNVINTIHAHKPQSLSYNPAGDRVFCRATDTLVVIDGTSDSVVAAHAGRWGGLLVANAAANRVYVSGLVGSGAGVFVLDGTTGNVLDSMHAGVDAMCLNSRTQRLYTCDKLLSSVSVFDCITDTLIGSVGVGALNSAACDTLANRIYIAGTNEIVAIDGAADAVVARITAGCDYGVLLGSAKRNLMYCTGVSGTELSVVNTSSDTLFHTIKIGGGAVPMCYDSTDDKIYYLSPGVFSEVGAIDAATNLPVAHIQVGYFPEDMVWHAPTDKVYCAGRGVVYVIDAQADSVVKKLSAAPILLCSAPNVNKVYCGAEKLWAIDCNADSVVKTIQPMDVSDMCYAHTASYDKLYCNGMDHVWIVDCARDTIVSSYFLTAHAFASVEGKRVFCSGNDSLFMFDAAGDTPVAAVPWLAGSATALLYVPDAKKVYCACNGELVQEIMVVDAAACTLIARIPTRYPCALGYDEVSGLVYCCREWDNKVMFIDARTDRVVDSITPCLSPVSVTMVPAHNRAYVGNGGNSFIPVIRGEPPGVAEAEALLHGMPRDIPWPTILPGNSRLVVSQRSELLDADGRKICDIGPGQLELAHYRAGIYFLRAHASRGTVKILIVR